MSTQRFHTVDPSHPSFPPVENDFDSRPTRVGPQRFAEGTPPPVALDLLEPPTKPSVPSIASGASILPNTPLPTIARLPSLAEGTPPHATPVVVARGSVADPMPKPVPPNIVPFTRPRAIAEIAAANPRALEVKPVPMNNVAAETMHIPISEVLPVPVPMNNVAAETMHMHVTPVLPMPIQSHVPTLRRPVTAKTLLGVPALAVRTVATSGVVEARPATDAPAPQEKSGVAPATASPAIASSENNGGVLSTSQSWFAEDPEIGVATRRADQWGEYEDIGLGKPKKQKADRRGLATGVAQKMVVSTYRLVGFGILTLVVVILIGYIATTAFYFVNRSWAAPVTVSPSDEKVVGLKAQLAAQQNVRDRLAAELDDTDRAIAAQQDFQSEFARAIQSDLKGRQVALARVRQLANQAEQTRTQIRHANDDFAADHADKMAKEYDAGLIDRSSMLNGKYQLAQISTSNLSLAERQAEFEQRAQQLAEETRSLDAILANNSSSALTYDVLKIKRDYDQSKLELAHAMQNRKLVQASLVRQDEIIKGIQESAFLRVIHDKAVVAQVPYDNLKDVGAGTKLYSCKVAMVWCHEVGEVVVVLPGEVTFKHPRRDAVVRGQLVELKMSEPDAAAADVLFLGSEPLWF
jgi:hypothetical protein